MKNGKRMQWGRILPVGAMALAVMGSGHAGVPGPETTAEVRIVVDLTADGRRVPPPTRERPVIYLPVTSRDIPSGEGALAREQVHRWLAQALAAQGYLPVSPQHDRPSQLLVFQWGEIDPQTEEMDARVDDNNPLTSQTFWNERELLDLVAGRSANKAMPGWKRQKMREEAVAGRFFVRLIACDYEAAKIRKTKVLWHARVSTHSQHATLAGVLPVLIERGAAYFGRETKGPVVMQVPVLREGNVELGEAEVKEFLAPAPEKSERK